MRKFVLRTIASVLFIIAGLSLSHAQKVFYIYQHDGNINAFLTSDVDSIVSSHIGLDNKWHNDFQVQEVWTPDSVYRFLISEIDSVGFVTPETKYKKETKLLNSAFIDYVIGHSSDTLFVDPQIPGNLKPLIGEKLLCEESCPNLPNGFMGQVSDIIDTDTASVILCTPLRLCDVYDTYYGYIDSDRIQYTPEAKRNGIYSPVNSNLNRPIDLSFLKYFTPSISIPTDMDDVAWNITPSFNVVINPNLRITGLFIVNEGIENYANVLVTGTCDVDLSVGFSGGIHKDVDIDILRLAYEGFYPLEVYAKVGLLVSGSVDASIDATWHNRYKICINRSWVPLFSSGKVLKDVTRVSCISSEMDEDSRLSLSGNARLGCFYELGLDVGNEKLDKVDVRLNCGVELTGEVGFSKSDIDNAGSDTGLYNLLKSQEIRTDIFGELFGEIKLMNQWGASTPALTKNADNLNYTFTLVPKFKDVSLDRSSSSIFNANCTATGKTLFPCKVGMYVKDKYENCLWSDYSMQPFHMKDVSFSAQLEGIHVGKQYILHPTVDVMGIKMLASPTSEIMLAPEISEVDVDDIATSSASCSAYIADYDGSYMTYGIAYKESKSSEWQYVKGAGIANGRFSSSLSSLKEKTTYQCKAYVCVEDEYFYGDVTEFTTLAPPEAVTGDVVSLTMNSAKVSCTFNYIPKDADVECGVQLDNRRYYSMSTTSGTYNYTFSDLQPNSSHTYRAYIKINEECYFGDVKNFTTTDNPNTIPSVSDIDYWSAKLHVSYSNVPDGGVCCVYFNEKTYELGKTDGDYELELNGLEPGMKYYGYSYVEYEGNQYRGEKFGNFSVTTKTLPHCSACSYADLLPGESVVLEYRLFDATAEMNLTTGIEIEGIGEKLGEYVSDNGRYIDYKCVVPEIKPYITYKYRSFVVFRGERLCSPWYEYTTYVCTDHNHPHMIDLGLSSGTLWSCCNLKAASPMESGGFYAWGETSEKSEYIKENYQHRHKKKNDYGQEYYVCDNFDGDIQGTKHDAAHVVWGNGWVTPTAQQTKELFENTYQEVVRYRNTDQIGVVFYVPFSENDKGKNGLKSSAPSGHVYSSRNEKHIFIPLHGIKLYDRQEGSNKYTSTWTSNPSDDNNFGYSIYGGVGNFSGVGATEIEYRWNGLNIRPVK